MTDLPNPENLRPKIVEERNIQKEWTKERAKSSCILDELTVIYVRQKYCKFVTTNLIFVSHIEIQCRVVIFVA